ncbi:MAG TPA: sodium:proton antiporter [Candidatus Acidoferrum sp.]|jgi:CPA1 family monovalent cation:H+ antiporter|nr:sodium:proton antiporter [Candidatus Acidoferrum sp.]
MTSEQRFLLLLILVGALATVLGLVSKRARLLPYPVVLAAAGVVIGLLPGGQLGHVGSDVILLAFVPGLIFEAALTLDLPELRRRLVPIGLLATAGVALTVVLIGTLTHLILGLGWASGMLLGAILAATDPIAVVTLMRQMKAPSGLSAILEGESLFNDGTGVAVFTAVLATIVSGAPSIGDASLRFVEITAGGTVIGLAVGFLGLLLLRFAADAPLEILATLVIAYGGYLAADVLHASGIVAVVVAGIVVARYGSAIGRLHGPQLLGFWNLLAFVLNAMLFILVGAALPAWELLPVLGFVAVVFVIMLVTRAIPVYGLLALSAIRPPPIPWAWRHLTFWAGLRGALSVALALSVTNMPGVDRRVALIAYGVVLLSLLVQGGLVVPVTHALRIEDAA